MNKAILLGRLVRDPELRNTQNGTAVVSFTLAVDRRFKNAQGERQTDFIPCVAWRSTAEFVARYFTQGQRMALVGSIQPRSWDDAEGNKRYTTEIIADEVYFADSKKSDGSSYGSQSSYGSSGSSSGYGSGSTPSAGSYGGGQSYSGKRPTTSEGAEGDGFFPAPEDDTALPFDL
ncbi:MAG: single-stranded DNA-binding protein [Fastidiosipilaceae bacterium]|jgi:single-strand DNA-binding protein